MLAWSILPVVVVTGVLTGSVHQTQVSIRMANYSSSSTDISVTSSISTAAIAAAATSPALEYVVQPGDTLSGLAVRLSVPGGWQALYAANRTAIGPDPDVIHPGLALRLPGRPGPFRYRVAAGDTLSGIAAALAVRGGWQALYAANRTVIGANPNEVRAGIVLRVPGPAQAAPRPSSPGHGRPASPSGTPHHPVPHHPVPVTGRTPRAGLPGWLEVILLAAGLIVAIAFLAEPVLAVRRRRTARTTAPSPAPGGPSHPARSGPSRPAPSGPPGPGAAAPAAAAARIVQADYDRVVVTCSKSGDTIYVLRPPGADPAAILRVAGLILDDKPYRELATHLGMPASWPIVLADYDRLVVTRNQRDDTVCVLRPPGADPEAILRAARLVLPEGAYGELADQLGVPASWGAE